MNLRSPSVSSWGKLEFTGWACLAVVFYMLGRRLFLSAFTSGDDGYSEITALSGLSLFQAGWDFAVFQGRFYQILIYPLALLPFVGESIWFANICKVVTDLAVILSIAWLGFELWGRAGALGCSALFLGLFDTVGGLYNSWHGLPLWFGLGCASLVASLASFLRELGLRNGRTKISTTLFAFALLTYEIVLLFVPIYLILAYLSSRQFHTRHDSLCAAIFRIRWIVMVVFVYLLCYACWRLKYPGTYIGSQSLTFDSAARMLRPILSFSIHSIYIPSDWPVAFSIESVIVSFCVSFALLIALGLSGIGTSKASTDKGWHGSIGHLQGLSGFSSGVLFVYIFSAPNLLFGFLERYRIWAEDGVRFYLGSIYSAVVVSGTLWAFASRRPSLHFYRRVGQWIFVGAVALLSLLNSLQSERFYAQSAAMSVRWGVASWAAEIVGKSEWKREGQRILVCGVGFTQSNEWPTYFRNPDFIADVDVYWSRYFSRHSGYQVQYSFGPSNDLSHCDAILTLSYRDRKAGLRLSGNLLRVFDYYY